MLFGVRFGYKVAGAGPGRAPPGGGVLQLAEDYGITIQDDWIEELERTYGVKL
jgi:hypothetical protein